MAVLTIASSVCAAADDTGFSALVSLARQKQFEACVQYAKDLKPEQRATAEILYVAGICALRSNRPYRARVWLTQLLERDANFPGAWFAKAQDDYLLHDAQALAVSRLAMATAPLPEDQKAEASAWLESLNRSERRNVLSFNGDIGAGHTSNANAGTTDSDFLGTPIPDLFKKTASDFTEGSVGVTGLHAFGPFEELLGALRFSRRSNNDAPFADQSVLAAALTYRRPLGRWSGEFSLLGFDETVGGVPQRLFGSLELAMGRRIADVWELSAIGRAGRMNYRVDGRPDLDVWRFFWNVNAARLLGSNLSARVGAGLYGGGDEEVVLQSSFGNSRIGVRTFADMAAGSHVQLSGEAAFSYAQFDGNGFRGETRRDKQSSLIAAGSWKLDPASRWAIQLRFVHRRLDSNVSAFGFDQNEIRLSINVLDK